MSILKQIQERTALLEVSKNLLRNYIKGAQKDLNNHPEGSAKFDSRVDNGIKAIDKVEGPNISKTTRGPKCPACGSDENSGVRAYKVAGSKGPWMSQCTKCKSEGKKSWFHDHSHYCVEEVEVLSEANVNQAAEKLAKHGYKKFGTSDRVDHKQILSHYHNEKTGHLICVDHREHGKINSVSTLKCTNTKTGEMEKKWGKEHPHVEHALQELGHKSYIGFHEEKELEEGKRRGRPKKARHEDGEIVNDPDANDTRPAN